MSDSFCTTGRSRLLLAFVVTSLLAGAGAGCASVRHQVSQWTPSGKRHTETKFNIAQLHERQGKLREAQATYLEIFEKDPKNATVCHRLGVVACRMGESDRAIDYLQQARKLDPSRTQILNDLGYALFLEDRLDEAEAILKVAAENSPNDPRVINNLAMVVGHQGRIDESSALFRRHLSEAATHANIAYIHVQRGEGDLAMQRYSRALTLDSTLAPASQALVQLSTLQQEHSRNLAASRRNPPAVAQVSSQNFATSNGKAHAEPVSQADFAGEIPAVPEATVLTPTAASPTRNSKPAR